MRDEDKIGIMWIDDQNASYPERVLPAGLQDHFAIVRQFRSSAGFRDVLKQIVLSKPSRLAPAEIVAMDYDLGRESKLGIGDGSLAPPPADTPVRPRSAPRASQAPKRPENFHGLVMGLFYGIVAHGHPVAVVPMTNYPYDQFPDEAKLLHELGEPFLRVDFSEPGRLNAATRSWTNVIGQGVARLRHRIKDLYSAGEVVISPNTLVTLAEDGDEPAVEIISALARRRLPLDGIFVDIERGEARRAAIRSWAIELLREIGSTSEQFKKAEFLANKVWSAYDDNTRVENRERLSLLYSAMVKAEHDPWDLLDNHKEALSDEQTELVHLMKVFSVAPERRGRKAKNKPATTDGQCGEEAWMDIRWDRTIDRQTRRWAILFVLLNLVRRIVEANVELRGAAKRHGVSLGAHELTTDDIYLALFPVPRQPISYPWHKGDSPGDKDHNWNKVLATCGLDLGHVLDGEIYSPEAGALGLRVVEKQLLIGKLLDQMRAEVVALDTVRDHRVEMLRRLQQYVAFPFARAIFGKYLDDVVRAYVAATH